MEQKEIEEYEERQAALEREMALPDQEFLELKDLWERSRENRLKVLREIGEELGIEWIA